MRFALRTIFVIILLAAILFAVARLAGYFVGSATVFAVGMIIWSIMSQFRGWYFYMLRSLVCIAGLTGLWFAAVDWSWFENNCHICFVHQGVAEYRVFTVPVSTKYYRMPGSTVHETLHDLGVPCEHPGRQREHIHRFWGLLICKYPCINGIRTLTISTNEYTPELAALFAEIGRNDPERAQKVHDLVVKQQDYQAFWEFYDEVAGEQALRSEGE